MPPGISPEMVQRLLPFMEKLALSPKSDQPLQIAKGLMQMTDRAPAAVSPWRKFLNTIPEEGLNPEPGLGIFRDRHNVSFVMKPQGQMRSLSGSLNPAENPQTAHLSYLGSEGSPRISTGAGDMPMMNYTMDISSPAQREIPFRGQKLSQAEKQQRVPRTPEEREVNYAGPPIPLSQKQQAFDTLSRMLRQAGFKNMSFEAEVGERPRLYQTLTGFKPVPERETKIEDILRNFPGAQSRPSATGTDWMRGLNTTTSLPEGYIEQATGMSAQEAVLHGFAKEAGPGQFMLTDKGVADAQNWLRGQQ